MEINYFAALIYEVNWLLGGIVALFFTGLQGTFLAAIIFHRTLMKMSQITSQHSVPYPGAQRDVYFATAGHSYFLESTRTTSFDHHLCIGIINHSQYF